MARRKGRRETSAGGVIFRRFDGGELWGESTEPKESLYLDLWESYLLPA